MGTSSDRARLRTDLRELAKLAGSDSTPAPHAFESADSSGFVDLSAFSAADDSGTSLDTWVERELARAGGRAKGGAVLTPGSMAPVAMSSLLGQAEAVDTVAGARKRGWVYTGLGIFGAAVVAVLAVALARHAPPSAKIAAQADVAAAAAPLPAPATPAAAPQERPVTPVASAPVAPIAVTVSAPDPAPTPKKHPARWHGSPAAVAAPVAAAARPAPTPRPAKVTIPAAKSGGGGGDSLMDLMRASINSPKKVH